MSFALAGPVLPRALAISSDLYNIGSVASFLSQPPLWSRRCWTVILRRRLSMVWPGGGLVPNRENTFVPAVSLPSRINLATAAFVIGLTTLAMRIGVSGVHWCFSAESSQP